MDNERYFIYGRISCPFCIAAINFCSASKKEYYFFDFEESAENLAEVKEFYSSKTVPIVLSNNVDSGLTRLVGGYTDLLDHIK